MNLTSSDDQPRTRRKALPNDGAAFEASVAALLKLYPACDVERHVRIAGKDVDIVITMHNAITGTRRLAVECKDHNIALSRRLVAEVIADYVPVVTGGTVDGLLLVTRNGVVANGRTALEAAGVQHLNERELLDAVISTERLIQSAEAMFKDGGLDQYYEPASAQTIDLTLATSRFNDYYDHSLEIVLHDGAPLFQPRVKGLSKLPYSVASEIWAEAVPREARDLSPSLHEVLDDIVADRLSDSRSPLMELARGWIDVDTGDVPVGLAILGSYGTGKSTFAKALAAEQAAEFRAGRSGRVPLLIELRHFGSHLNIEGLVADELANRHGVSNCSFATFQALNAAGRFLLILDGFDEMKEGMTTEALTYNFAELNRLLVGQAKVMLCGRPTVFQSLDEQHDILAARHADAAAEARYIRLDIAPMTLPQIERAIAGFVEVRRNQLGPGIDQRVAELKRQLEHDDDLQELLSRPVHYPMLLGVLPRWNRPLAELTRSMLYEEFIRQTISREMKPGRLPTIPADERLRFASDLATAMFAQGDSRSIRWNSIPEAIIVPHRRGNESLDATRRDLVKSCFLEQKAPDILFFPHKSFGEYLTARAIVEAARADTPDTDSITVTLTPEICSFVDELMSVDDWLAVVGAIESNQKLIRKFCALVADLKRWIDLVRPRGSDLVISLSSFRRAWAKDEAFDRLGGTSLMSHAPLGLQIDVASGLEGLVRIGDRLPPAGIRWMHDAAAMADDNVAIHAYRGLQASGSELVAQFAHAHPDRWASWQGKGWLNLGAKRQ